MAGAARPGPTLDPAARRTAALRAFSRGTGAVVVLIGCLVLAGWLLGVETLKSILPGLISMKVNTAVAFVLAGVALWLLQEQPAGARTSRIAHVCALIVALLSLLTLGEYLFGWSLGIDQALFVEPAGTPETTYPGRMAPATAASFVLLGGALLFVDAKDRGRRWLAEAGALTVSLVAFLGLVGYGYGARPLYRLGASTPMALHTAALFLILSVGVLASRADSWLSGLVMNPGAAGLVARRLLPAVTGILLLVGWLRLQGQRAGLYDTEFGASLTIVAGIVFVTLAVVWSAAALNRADAERQQAALALRESERRLFQLLDAVPVGVFVADDKGKAHYANQQAQEILGKGLVGGAGVSELPEVYHAYVAGTNDVYPADRQPIVHALAGEKAHVDIMEIHRPDRIVPIEVWASPVLDAAGRVTHAVAAFTDITERERARTEIERLNAELAHRVAELEAVNRELDTFCYSVSHDLRAPLRAIDGFSRMLVEDHGTALDAQAQRLLGVIRSNTQRMGQLIDDLLTFSRYSRKSLETSPVEMTAVVQSVVDELRTNGAVGRADIVVHPLPRTRGDATLLRQVWANLIGNAGKFTRTRSEPRVEIGALGGQGETVFFVRDNGVGFDMEYARKLFGVFQRLHRAEEFEGSGVGLAIVQRIVHRHGGRVWAEAKPEAGATFYFTLPTTG